MSDKIAILLLSYFQISIFMCSIVKFLLQQSLPCFFDYTLGSIVINTKIYRED